MQTLVIVALVFALAVSIFAVQNSTPVDIKILAWSFSDISLVVIILGAFSAGVLLTILLNAVRNFKQMLQVKDLENKNRVLNEEKQRLLDEITRLKTARQQDHQTGHTRK